MKIYVDNAASTPIDKDVLEAMFDVLSNSYGNPSSIHEQGRKARNLIEQARKTIANGINSSIGEIFFTSGATESNNTILCKVVENMGIRHIVSSKIEHPSIMNTIRYLEQKGAITYHPIAVDKYGMIDTQNLEQKLISIGEKALVCCMAVNNEIGTLYPIKEIAEIVHQHNCLIHTDAVQRLGKYPVDVMQMGVDFLTGTAHKFHGPKGTGFMYINSKNMIAPLLTGGSQERNMRAGTENIAGIVGLKKSFELAIQNMEQRTQKISSLKKYFKQLIQKQFPKSSFNENPENSAYHVLSTNFPTDQNKEMAIFNLDIRGICASAGSACSSGSNKASHVITALGVDPSLLTIRFSFSHHNTIEELDYIIQQLQQILY